MTAAWTAERRAPRGEPLLDDDVLILTNGFLEPVPFTIHEIAKRSTWRTELDSFDLGAPVAPPAGPGASSGPGAGSAAPPVSAEGGLVTVRPRSFILLVTQPT